jgi:hypothetical protein
MWELFEKAYQSQETATTTLYPVFFLANFVNFGQYYECHRLYMEVDL